MKPRAPYSVPPEEHAKVRPAVRLEWISLGIQCTTVALMATVMGSSQAMRTAWAEDTLSLVPPLAFLISNKLRRAPPSESYPYGGEHPTIEYVWLADHRIWLGWLMIPALVYSIVPTIVLGHLKLPLARALHAKVLRQPRLPSRGPCWPMATARCARRSQT